MEEMVDSAGRVPVALTHGRVVSNTTSGTMINDKDKENISKLLEIIRPRIEEMLKGYIYDDIELAKEKDKIG